MQVIKLKAKVKKKLYYNEESMFGVFSFAAPSHSDQPVKLDSTWNNFVASGVCTNLTEGKEYTFSITPSKSKKYKDGYDFVEFEQPALDTVEAQQNFLREVVSESYAENIINTYPNDKVLDLIINNEIDVSKIKGLREKTFDDRVKSKVIESYGIAQSIVELRELNISGNQIKKLISHFGNQDVLIEKIKANIYSLTEVSGFGFVKIDEYAMKRGDNPNSSKRIKACIDYILESEGSRNGHTWLDLNKIKDVVVDTLDIEISLVYEVFKETSEGKYKTLSVDGKRLALTKNLNYERNLAKELKRINSSFKGRKGIDIKDIEKELGINYTEEQKNAITLTKDNGVVLLNGRAGTGKSATIVGVTKTLSEVESYISCALSGQAVKVLSGRGIDASTIHRLRGANKDKKINYDLIVIDEMSMVSVDLALSIISLIPSGSQLLLTGDIGQLPAIGIGSPFIDLITSGDYAHQELTVIHRQALKSGITEYANKVYEGNQINGYMDRGLSILGELNDFKLIPMHDKLQILPTVLNVAQASYNQFGKEFIDDFVVLCVNKSRGELSVDYLNIKLREIFNVDNIKKSKPFRNFYKGDKVIHNGNNKQATMYDTLIDYKLQPETTKQTQVYNGSIGYIVDIDEKEGIIFIDFNDVDGIIAYEGEDVFKISLAYAITVHRSQGIGIKNVLLTFDFGGYTLLSKQLVYTGMTRAIEILVMIVENRALHKAIKTDLGHTRQTFLCELVKGEF